MAKTNPVQGSARSLREVLQEADEDLWLKRFNEAEKLAQSIFSDETPYVPLPYFTPHGVSHCKAVEECLNKIIWGTEESNEDDFVPSPKEAMYVLSAAWLHDIGMMYGIFDGEDPEDLQDSKKVIALRAEHELRTSKYIHDRWHSECGWSDEQKVWLTNICVYHRRHHPLSTLCPRGIELKSRGGEERLRLGVLAALLRLADACHVDQSRAPGPLMALYNSLGMPQDAVCHWERAKLISDVEFDRTRNRINLRGLCPPVFNFGLGSFDLQEITEIVRSDVEEELRSVQPVLMAYPNTAFWEVTREIFHAISLTIHKEKQCLAVWPYLLHIPSSATETVAALIQLLLFAIQKGEDNHNLGDAWRKNLLAIIGETEKARPVDFMIRNLHKKVLEAMKSLAPEAGTAEPVKKCLQDSLKEIEKNCFDLAQKARQLIDPQDVLVVYGFSTNIAKLLENLRGQYSNVIYVVDCYRPVGRVHLSADENERVIGFAQGLGFEQVVFVQLAALPQALNDLKQRRVPCKILLGTHGVLENGDFLCKVGSYMIVSTARQFDAQVVAFAEKTKFLSNGESDAIVAAFDRLFPRKEWTQHPVFNNTPCIDPAMDLIPKSLITDVVREEQEEPDSSNTCNPPAKYTRQDGQCNAE